MQTSAVAAATDSLHGISQGEYIQETPPGQPTEASRPLGRKAAAIGVRPRVVPLPVQRTQVGASECTIVQDVHGSKPCDQGPWPTVKQEPTASGSAPAVACLPGSVVGCAALALEDGASMAQVTVSSSQTVQHFGLVTWMAHSMRKVYLMPSVGRTTGQL